jgi:hypothetical protein
VIASKSAAIKFVEIASNMIDTVAHINPNRSASREDKRPDGIGLFAVRDIIESVPASYHILSAPAEPAPTAIAIVANIALVASILLGAIIIPTIAVKMAKDMTRGFAKAKKSGALPK